MGDFLLSHTSTGVYKSNYSLAGVDDWKGSEPRNRKGKIKKATLVDPEETKTDEDSEEEGGREISQQPDDYYYMKL